MVSIVKIIVEFFIEIIVALIATILAYFIIKFLEEKYAKEKPAKEKFAIAIFVSLVVLGILLSVLVYMPVKDLAEVPDLTGMSKSQAEDLLKKNGLLPSFREAFNKKAGEEMIVPLTQSPQPGTIVRVGGEVKADVSLGEFPVVIGESKEEAKRQFENVGLEINFIEQCSNVGPDNHVISQNPIDCTYPESCPTVEVSISKIPKVPDVENLTKEEAKNKIENAGLRAKFVSEGYSDKISPGKVICQYQKPDTIALCDSEVEIIVSKGPHTVSGMNNTGEWGMFRDGKGSSSEIRTVSGKIGYAIEITYNLSNWGWLTFQKGIDTGTLSETKGIRFFYKGIGNPNTIELKLMYSDGYKYNGGDTTFGFSMNAATVKDEWTLVEVPYSEFDCWWSDISGYDNPVLDLNNVTKLEFAISNKPDRGDMYGSGTVIIDEIQGIVESEADCSK